MKSKVIKEVRCEDVLRLFMEKADCPVFFTLTTADVVDIVEIRKRWRDLRHWLVRQLPNGAKYVMNFEVHPKGHGWHIHSVFTHFIDLRRFQDKIRAFGFGRLDVRRVNTKGVADYLTKHALKAYRGVSRRDRQMGRIKRLRLVNTSRGLPVLDDYAWRSSFDGDRRAALEALKGTGFEKLEFAQRWRIAEIYAAFGGKVSLDVVGLLVCDVLAAANRMFSLPHYGQAIFSLGPASPGGGPIVYPNGSGKIASAAFPGSGDVGTPSGDAGPVAGFLPGRIHPTPLSLGPDGVGGL